MEMWKKVKALRQCKFGFCGSLPHKQKPVQKPEYVFFLLYTNLERLRGKKKEKTNPTALFHSGEPVGYA